MKRGDWTVAALLLVFAVPAWAGTNAVWDGDDDLIAAEKAQKDALIENLREQLCVLDKAQCPSKLQLSGYGGVVVSMGSDVTGYEPALMISAQAPLSNHPKGPVLDVTGEMLADQDASVETGDITVFKSLELGAAVWQPLFPSQLRFGLYGQFGAASRRKGEQTPAVKSPLWATIGLGIRSPDHSNYLAVGLGPDERISDYAQFALTVQAKATLPALRTGALKGGTAALVVSIVRGLDISTVGEGHPNRNGGRSSVRVALMAGWQ